MSTKTKDSKQIDTIERTITIKLPKKFDEVLQSLAKALNRHVESLLLEELYATCESFFQGGFADGWIKEITQTKLAKEMENEVSKIAEIVLKE